MLNTLVRLTKRAADARLILPVALAGGALLSSTVRAQVIVASPRHVWAARHGVVVLRPSPRVVVAAPRRPVAVATAGVAAPVAVARPRALVIIPRRRHLWWARHHVIVARRY